MDTREAHAPGGAEPQNDIGVELPRGCKPRQQRQGVDVTPEQVAESGAGRRIVGRQGNLGGPQEEGGLRRPAAPRRGRTAMRQPVGGCGGRLRHQVKSGQTHDHHLAVCAFRTQETEEPWGADGGRTVPVSKGFVAEILHVAARRTVFDQAETMVDQCLHHGKRLLRRGLGSLRQDAEQPVVLQMGPGESVRPADHRQSRRGEWERRGKQDSELDVDPGVQTHGPAPAAIEGPIVYRQFARRKACPADGKKVAADGRYPFPAERRERLNHSGHRRASPPPARRLRRLSRT